LRPWRSQLFGFSDVGDHVAITRDLGDY